MSTGEEDPDPYLGHDLRGVSVHHLKTVLLDSVKNAGLDANDVKVHDIEEKVIRGAGRDVRCPRDHELGAAYIDSIHGPDNAGLSEYMLSYTWYYKVKDIVDTLSFFCEEQNKDPKRTYVWICCLCVNQWRVVQAKERQEVVPFDEFRKTFSTRVESIGCVLAMLYPWRNPAYTSRVWCDFELFTAVSLNKRVMILTPPAERADLRESLMLGSGVADVWNVLMGIDIQKAEATVPQDRMNIFQIIQNECGFETLNSEVSKFLREWVVRTSEFEVRANMSSKVLYGENAVKMCSEVGHLLTDLSLWDQAANIMDLGFAESDDKGLVNKLCHARLLQSMGELLSKQNRFSEALEKYGEARRIREHLKELNTAEGAELLRLTGITLKHSGDINRARKCLEDAKCCRDEAGELLTREGADLLRSMGALAQDHFCDLDSAWELYMEGMGILCKIQAVSTPSGAYLMMCMGNVMRERLDVINACEIYAEARRIRVRSGTLQTPGGRMLERYIKDGQNEELVQRIADVFRSHDKGDKASGLLLGDHSFLFQNAEPALEVLRESNILGQGCLDYKRLLSFAFPDSCVARSLQADVSGVSKTVGNFHGGFPLLDATWKGRSHSVLVWNIQSPEHCANTLEFLPGANSISTQGRRTMAALSATARDWMLRAVTTKNLKELLGEEEPLKRATDLEKAPLTHEKTLEGLEKWLEKKKPLWTRVVKEWQDWTSRQLTEKWAADYKTRWAYWKEQKVLDWLRDDCSGGKVNPLLLPAYPTVDDLCWNLGLSSADRAFAKHPERARRARWLASSGDDKSCALPATGKFDFFKLLVWDMVLEKLLKESVDPAALEALLKELKPMESDERIRMILDRVQQADIAVLTEVPVEGLSGLERFWVVDTKEGAQAHQDHYITTILARRDQFEEPAVKEFTDKDGKPSTRAVGCTLTRKSDKRRVRVIGVHLPGRGQDDEGVIPQIEAALAPNAILAGDFNIDLRRKVPPWASDQCPRVASLVKQAKHVPLSFGTSNKQRSPFQAQVSKMFLQDFSMKDFALLGDCFCPSVLEGVVSRVETLPSKDIPSDHAPLAFQLLFGDILDP